MRRPAGAVLLGALLLSGGCGAPREAAIGAQDRDVGAARATEGVPAEAAPGRMRLAQVFVLPGRYPWEVQAELSALKRDGATAVALRAFHLPGDRPHGWAAEGAPRQGTWFRSAHSPLVADLVPVFVQAAHEEGLEAWAWMTTLGSRWLLEGHPDREGWSVDPMTGRLERSGRLDPFHPEVREALRGMYRDLGATGVDGILYQDDLVLRHGEGYGPHSLRACLEEEGLDADPALFYEEVRRGQDGRVIVGRYTDAYRRWTRWRARKLLGLAEELGAAAREGAGGPLAVGLNVYYDELWTPEGGLLWLARDLDASLERGFDRYVVMAYHRQIGSETARSGDALFEALATMAGRLAGKVAEPERAVVKLQSLDWRTGERVPLEELQQAARPWLEAADFSLGIAPAASERSLPFALLEAPPAEERR